MNTVSRNPAATRSSLDSPVRAAIYVRISQDRTGAGLGVARQEDDCRDLCTRKSWTVARVYVDNDVSAYSGRPRPQWQRLLADITAGRIGAIACWHVDRLTRSPRELEDAIDLHDTRGIALATATGEIDLSTPAGRMIARTLGAAARHEAEHKAERQRRERRQQAQAGKPHSSGTRGYGYAADKVTIVDEEAAIVRETVTRVLAGESMGSIARDLNARQVPTASGGRWMIPTLKAVLISARISGRREYHGEIMHEQSWPAIITPAVSDQLRALLTRTRPVPATARTYLLSGILRCANCGKGLGGRPHHGRRRYVCAKSPGNGKCGTIMIMADLAETEVRDQVLTALDVPEFLARLMTSVTTGTDAEHITSQLRAIDERRDELAGMWAAGELSRKEWLAARAKLAAEADNLTATLASSEHGRALAEFAAMEGDLWHRWDELTVGARRALVTAVTDHIDVHPAGHTGRRFDPDRIHPIWRT